MQLRRQSQRRQQAASRGITRFELTLGLVLGVTLCTGAGLWLGGGQQDKQRGTAMHSAKQLLEVASEWKRDHGDLGCPTLTQLRHDRRLDREAHADDPWGGRFRISCAGTRMSVKSAGGDGEFETDDDISIDRDWNS